MSKDPKQNKGELAPSINRGLVLRESRLVKRGLELIKELKQPLRLLIGDLKASGITELISQLIGQVIKDK